MSKFATHSSCDGASSKLVCSNQCWSSLQLLTHCLLVSLACHMGEDFTPQAHAAIDKYLSAFAAVLAEKYR